MERDLAERSELGFIGKNTLLINERIGSGLFLGEILTTLPLMPSPPRKKYGACGACSKCQSACPTAAFTSPYVLDARKCDSCLTIEHPGPIDEDLRPLMGNHIYGCDVCQQVCPWNRVSTWRHVEGSPLFGKPPESITTPPCSASSPSHQRTSKHNFMAQRSFALASPGSDGTWPLRWATPGTKLCCKLWKTCSHLIPQIPRHRLMTGKVTPAGLRLLE